jgi:hypothetical protein
MSIAAPAIGCSTGCDTGCGATVTSAPAGCPSGGCGDATAVSYDSSSATTVAQPAGSDM